MVVVRPKDHRTRCRPRLARFSYMKSEGFETGRQKHSRPNSRPNLERASQNALSFNMSWSSCSTYSALSIPRFSLQTC